MPSLFQGRATLEAVPLCLLCCRLQPLEYNTQGRAGSLVWQDCCLADLRHKQFPIPSELSCLQVSITFDPFLYLPVPLPQKQKVLTVYYFAKEPHKKPIKVKDTNYSGEVAREGSWRCHRQLVLCEWAERCVKPGPACLNVVLTLWQFLVSISKENSSAMEVLDSVAHSVHVKPDNLRLAEVRMLKLTTKLWTADVGAPGSHSCAEHVATSSHLSMG